MTSIRTKPSTDITARPVKVDVETGTNEELQVVKPAFGPTGVATFVEDATAKRLPVGGAAIGEPADPTASDDGATPGSLIAFIKRLCLHITNQNALVLGLSSDAPAASDVAPASINAILKRMDQQLSNLYSFIGTTTDSAPGTDTATASLNGRMQRTAQNITSLNTMLQGLLGATADAVVAAGAAGSISAKLRRVTQGLEDLKTGISLSTGFSIIGAILRIGTFVTASVANGATVSAAATMTNYEMAGIVVPSTFDGTQISFQVSADGVTYQPLYTALNDLVIMTVAAGRSYPLWAEATGWSYLKVVCLTAQTTSTTDFLIVGKS